MGFYDIPENVDKYIDMCSGYDGSLIYSELQNFLKDGKTILELGSGPGLDLSILRRRYCVTGSDLSKEFISRLQKKYPGIPFLKINATDIDVEEKYDCIYSNKVLHHLTKSELINSLSGQAQALSPGGIIAHTFWIGDDSEEIEGLLFNYYGKDEILEIITEKYNIFSSMSYSEFEDSDSLLVIAGLK